MLAVGFLHADRTAIGGANLLKRGIKCILGRFHPLISTEMPSTIDKSKIPQPSQPNRLIEERESMQLKKISLKLK